MGDKMNNAPVFYALAQVRFNPFEFMSKYVPEIQDQLRREGFPDFQSETAQRIELKLPEGKPEIQIHPETRWNFMDSKQSEGYLLYPNSLVFHTTYYDSFDIFIKRLIMGLELIHRIEPLAYIERIGLRYLNAIYPEPGRKLDEYLQTHVLGLSDSSLSHDEFVHSLSETVVRNPPKTLVSRVLIRDADLAIPAELYPLRLKFNEHFLSIKGRHAILDNDQFIEQRTEFDIEATKSEFTSVHELAEQAFKIVMKPLALLQYQ